MSRVGSAVQRTPNAKNASESQLSPPVHIHHHKGIHTYTLQTMMASMKMGIVFSATLCDNLCLKLFCGRCYCVRQPPTNGTRPTLYDGNENRTLPEVIATPSLIPHDSSTRARVFHYHFIDRFVSWAALKSESTPTDQPWTRTDFLNHLTKAGTRRRVYHDVYTRLNFCLVLIWLRDLSICGSRLEDHRLVEMSSYCVCSTAVPGRC